MSGVTYPRTYEVVTYPEGIEGTEGWAGFRARILANPNGAERRQAARLFREYTRQSTAENEDAFWQAVAPRVIEWNYEARQEDGTTVTYPAPAEQWDVIYELEPVVMLWLALQIQIVFLPKATARTAGQDSAPAAGTTDTTPPIPIHPSSSSTPSGSTLSA